MIGKWIGALKPPVEVEQHPLPENWQIEDATDPKHNRAAVAFFEEMFEPLWLNGGAFDNAMDVVSVLSEPETYPDWHMKIVQDIFTKLAETRLPEAQRRAVELVEAHLASRSIWGARDRVKTKARKAMRG